MRLVNTRHLVGLQVVEHDHVARREHRSQHLLRHSPGHLPVIARRARRVRSGPSAQARRTASFLPAARGAGGRGGASPHEPSRRSSHRRRRAGLIRNTKQSCPSSAAAPATRRCRATSGTVFSRLQRFCAKGWPMEPLGNGQEAASRPRRARRLGLISRSVVPALSQTIYEPIGIGLEQGTPVAADLRRAVLPASACVASGFDRRRRADLESARPPADRTAVRRRSEQSTRVVLPTRVPSW